MELASSEVTYETIRCALSSTVLLLSLGVSPQ